MKYGISERNIFHIVQGGSARSNYIPHLWHYSSIFLNLLIEPFILMCDMNIFYQNQYYHHCHCHRHHQCHHCQHHRHQRHQHHNFFFVTIVICVTTFFFNLIFTFLKIFFIIVGTDADVIVKVQDICVPNFKSVSILEGEIFIC